MKKISERSKIRQRRMILTIFLIIVLILLIISDLLNLLKHNKNQNNESMIRFLQSIVLPTKSLAPANKTNIPEAVISDDLLSEKDDSMLDSLMCYVLNENYPYGCQIKDGLNLESSSLMQIAGITEKGEPISIKQVTVGDIGVFGDYECICVGFDEDGAAVFAYASPYKTELLPQGGIYLGYVIEQKDSLYHGMYPIPCNTFYNCMNDIGKNNNFLNEIISSNAPQNKHSDDIYLLGRAFSEKNVGLLKSYIPPELMLKYNIEYSDHKLLNFLDKFPNYANAENIGDEYSMEVKSYFSLTTGTYMTVELISLSANNFLHKSGKWDITITKDGLVPFIDIYLDNYVGIFDKAQESDFVYDADGRVMFFEFSTINNQDGVITEDATGNRVYIEKNYTMVLSDELLYLEDNASFNSIHKLEDGQFLLVAYDGTEKIVDMSLYDVSDNTINRILQTMLEELNYIVQGGEPLLP